MSGSSFGVCNGPFRGFRASVVPFVGQWMMLVARRLALSGGMRRSAFRLSAALALAISVAGCGGGGGGGDQSAPTERPAAVDTDRDGMPDASDPDDDNDGVADADDAFPLDPDESVDTDGDGTGDNADADDDNDGVGDADDAFPLDPDESVDTDGDGTGDNADADDDNDGVLDGDDAFPLDPDRGGEPVEVPDAALRAALQAALHSWLREPGETLYAPELARLSFLEARSEGISSLEGLQFATGLRVLSLRDNRISDLGPLSGLTALKELDLGFNAVDDLSPLSGLTALEDLDIRVNSVIDLSPLSGLTATKDLNISGNAVNDLSPLSGLTALEDLDIRGNAVNDLSPLSGLTAIKDLDIGYNAVNDLSPLSGLTALEELYLFNNRVRDLSPLSGLTALEELELGYNAVGDLSPLSGLTALEDLEISNNAVNDLNPLSGLTAFKYLNITGNFVENLDPLSGLTALESLFIGRNRVEDLAPLSGLPALRELSIHQNPASNLTPLSGLTNLTKLWLGSEDMTDFRPLSGLTALTELSFLSGNVSDLTPLEGLHHLERLRIDSGLVSDLAPLRNLSELRYLDAASNDIVDLSPLAALPELKELRLQSNRIEDLSPLAENPGLNAGDVVDVRLNPLTAESVAKHAAALTGRGVEATFDLFHLRHEDGPRIHNDNLFVLPVPGDVRAGGWSYEDVARFYAHFEDAFDFLMLIPAERDRSVRFYGAYYSFANDTQGIGAPGASRPTALASASRLQGLIYFPRPKLSIESGPALHEVMHRWANYIVRPTSHWRFTSAYGQLGGFRAERLVDLGAGRYTAGRFGLVANGGNGVPYSPIELYLAGLLPPDEVPDLLVAEDAEYLYENGRPVYSEAGHPIFTASRIAQRSVEDIVAEHGIRMPNHTRSQRAFRAAAILLIDQATPAYASRLDELSEEVAWFANAGDDGNDGLYNFHEATGGRATMAMGGLSEFNTGIPVPSTPTRISALSARARDVQDAAEQPRPGRLFQELEGSPRWPQVPEGHFGPAGSHPVWCRHESHGHVRVFGPPPARRSR